VIDLSEDLLLNKDLRYLVVLQLSFRNALLQELLLSGTHYQTPSPYWLRYHPSEAICLLHHARRRAHSIAEISVRRLAIIIHIQIYSTFHVKFWYKSVPRKIHITSNTNYKIELGTDETARGKYLKYVVSKHRTARTRGDQKVLGLTGMTNHPPSVL